MLEFVYILEKEWSSSTSMVVTGNSYISHLYYFSFAIVLFLQTNEDVFFLFILVNYISYPYVLTVLLKKSEIVKIPSIILLL